MTATPAAAGLKDVLPDVHPEGGPLAGRRIAVTATRKAAEQCGLLERRGAVVVHAPTLKEQAVVDHDALRRATETLVSDGVDVLVATTGTGVNAWLDAASGWDLDETLVATLNRADILARGPKSVGALRGHGMRELWSPDTEQLDDVLAHLRQRDLAGQRLVLQEHGQSLAVEAEALRRVGAVVTVVSTYRCEAADDLGPVFTLVDLVVDRALDAVTFTSAPAVVTLLQVAGFVACGLLAAMAWRLRVEDRRVSNAGLLVAIAALAPGLVTLVVAIVADPRHPASAERYNNLEPRGDDLLFLGIAMFGLAIVAARRRLPSWLAVLGAVVAATSVLRLALEALGQERGALDSLAPLSFLVLVGAVTWLSFRGSPRSR